MGGLSTLYPLPQELVSLLFFTAGWITDGRECAEANGSDEGGGRRGEFHSALWRSGGPYQEVVWDDQQPRLPSRVLFMITTRLPLWSPLMITVIALCTQRSGSGLKQNVYLADELADPNARRYSVRHRDWGDRYEHDVEYTLWSRNWILTSLVY